MTAILLYRNPACSKSRGALALLEDREVDFTLVEYLESPLGQTELEQILDQVEE